METKLNFMEKSVCDGIFSQVITLFCVCGSVVRVPALIPASPVLD